MTWLIPGLVVTITTTLLIGFLYLYLWYKEEERFLLLWSLGWLTYTLRFVAILLMTLSVLPPAWILFQQTVTVASGLCIVWGMSLFLGKRVHRAWLYAAGIVMLWTIAAEYYRFSFLAADLPNSFFVGFMYAWTGVMLLRHMKIAGTGARIAGFSLVLWGIHKADHVFLRPLDWFAPWGFLIASILFLISAIGVLLAYYEKVRNDLRNEIVGRSQAQTSLKESEQRYRALFEASVDAILLTSPGGRIHDANPAACRMLGMTSEEICAGGRGRIVDPDDGRLAVLLEERERTGRFRGEVRHRRKEGICFETEVTSAQFTTSSGAISAWTIIRDITVRKALENQLLQAQKMESIGRLAGGVAHDFNNMLGVIIGYAEIVLEKIDPKSPLHEPIEEILKAGRRSAELTRQLLAFARQQTIAPKVLDLNATVTGMIKMLQRLIGEDIQLFWSPAKDLWAIKIDPAQIDQILVNLCANTRDAISGVGKVVIETANLEVMETQDVQQIEPAPGAYVTLVVSDNGSGMDKETLEHLFEPFFTTRAHNRGTGLGLATVYGIVKQNGGHITVTSELGRGTTFTIYLPRFQGEEAIAVPKKKPEAAGQRETVLLVEDEAALLTLGRAMLQRLGYTVLCAHTPTEAIRIAERHAGRIRLLITDVVMPEMNGRDLAARLASLHPGLGCLYMSGYTSDVIAHRGVLEEGVLFIQKPFSSAELAAKVREALENPSGIALAGVPQAEAGEERM